MSMGQTGLKTLYFSGNFSIIVEAALLNLYNTFLGYIFFYTFSSGLFLYLVKAYNLGYSTCSREI